MLVESVDGRSRPLTDSMLHGWFFHDGEFKAGHGDWRTKSCPYTYSGVFLVASGRCVGGLLQYPLRAARDSFVPTIWIFLSFPSISSLHAVSSSTPLGFGKLFASIELTIQVWRTPGEYWEV